MPSDTVVLCPPETTSGGMHIFRAILAPETIVRNPIASPCTSRVVLGISADEINFGVDSHIVHIGGFGSDGSGVFGSLWGLADTVSLPSWRTQYCFSLHHQYFLQSLPKFPSPGS